MRKWLPLVAICTGTFMLLIDITIVNVALPDVATDLGTTFGQLQWVVDVYALALAALVLGAGSLADLYGRRKLYLIGLVLFALASLASGLAPNAGALIAARGLQGIGGAIMFATTIALINTSYEGRDRGTAFGVWGATVGASAALGPILGGALTELSWRWIFFINLPVCVLAVVLTLMAVEEARRPDAPRPDLPGIALFTLGAGAVVFGLVRAAADGWSQPRAWAPIAGGVAVLAGWVVVELRRPDPMLDVRLFRSRSFTGIMAGALLLNAAAFAALIYTSLWLQSFGGLSPLQAGCVFIPLSVLSFVVAGGGGRFLQTLPPRFVLGVGLLVIGAGGFLLALVDADSTWRVLVAGLAVLGAGVGMANPTLASAALAAVPQERSGMASGAVNTARQLGFALGVAVLGHGLHQWGDQCAARRRRLPPVGAGVGALGRSGAEDPRVRRSGGAGTAGRRPGHRLRRRPARRVPRLRDRRSGRRAARTVAGAGLGAGERVRVPALGGAGTRSALSRPDGRLPLMPTKPMPDDWQRALVVAAHPDDIEYGIAAAVAAWTGAGKEVHYLLATRGEAGMAGVPPEEAGPLREQEERRSAAVVGVTEVEFLDHRDGVLVAGPELRRDIAGAIRRHRPELVLTGYFGATWSPPGLSPSYVNSADHRALGQCVLDAVADAGNEWIFPDLTEPPWTGVQYIAVQDMLDPPHEVDVTEQVDTAVASLREHRRYLEILSEVPVEEQAQQIIDMATLTEDDRRRIGFRLYWG